QLRRARHLAAGDYRLQPRARWHVASEIRARIGLADDYQRLRRTAVRLRLDEFLYRVPCRDGRVRAPAGLLRDAGTRSTVRADADADADADSGQGRGEGGGGRPP